MTLVPIAEKTTRSRAPAEGPYRVMVVDDDEDSATGLAGVLESRGYPCATARGVEDAGTLAERFQPHVALVDVCLGSESGLELVGELKQAHPDLRCIMVSGYADTESALEAIRAEAHGFLLKPVEGDELLGAVEKCVEEIDLARRRAAEEQAHGLARELLERKNRRLEELRENAERFVDDVSHEFRTPLSVIMGFTSALAGGLAGPVTKDQEQLLGSIGKSVEDLSRMVSDLLDSSRIESSLRRVDRKPCKVAAVVRSVREALAKTASVSGVTLVGEIAPRLADVFADEEKLRRTWVNLAVNAIKFSSSGSRVTLWARPGASGVVECGVTDRGRGMSEEEVKQVLARARGVGSTSGLTTRGFGLGLHIARELVHLNLGEMSVSSRPGRGSTFSFTLPTCSRRAILDAWFSRLRSPDGPTRVSALEVVVEDAGRTDAAREFLVWECRPMDLILRDAKTGRLVLVGGTDTAADWAARLASARANAARPAPEMRIMPAGTWTCPSGRRDAAEAVTRLLYGKAPSPRGKD